MFIPENLIIRCLFEEPKKNPFGPDPRKSIQVSIRTNHLAVDQFTGADLKREIALQTSISLDHFDICLAPKFPNIISLNLIQYQPLRQLQDTDRLLDVFKTHRIWGATVTRCLDPIHCPSTKGNAVPARDRLEVIYTISGRKIDVDLDPMTTVAALKEEIAKQTGIPVNEQRLVYCGSQIGADDEVKLEGSTTLFSLGIRDGDRITVVERIPIGQRSLAQPSSS